MTEEIKKSCIEFAENPVALGVKWTANTSFSRTDKEIIPTCFDIEIGHNCKINIVIGHIYYPNTWMMNCYSLNIKDHPVKCTKAQDAAETAYLICKNRVGKLYEAFNAKKVCPECQDRGWLYDKEGRRTGTCPCHYE